MATVKMNNILGFVLGSIFLAGCYSYVSPYHKPILNPLRRKKVTFQVDPTDTELFSAATIAASKWAAALDADISVTSNGEIPIFWVDNISSYPGCEIPDDQNPNAWISGCAQGVGTEDAAILFSNQVPSKERLLRWIIHEMGHQLAGHGGHLDDEGNPPFPKDSIMQRYEPGLIDGKPSIADIFYVCQAPTAIIQCGPNQKP